MNLIVAIQLLEGESDHSSQPSYPSDKNANGTVDIDKMYL